MMDDILLSVGGVGLFILGIRMLTNGLRSLAGGMLRRFLARFTTNAASGAVTGALLTAVIQSSGATTITTVGLVGAGILSFNQALGVILGANIGTTVTGWIIAAVGFKLQLGTVAMPLLLLGVLTSMFAPGRWARAGDALTGFSLLFIGIDAMQRGMAAFEGLVTPETFPADSLSGRLELVAVGIVITLITHSSSAGVATALAALSVGTINLPQAATMVIGMNVGTTFSAALATIGGSAAVRRTGFAHVIFNVMTGVIAFGLLDLFAKLALPRVQVPGDAQFALVAFHTVFNVLGVVLVLPFAGAFSRLMAVLVPDHLPSLTGMLDRRLLADGEAAADAAAACARLLVAEIEHHVAWRLRPASSPGGGGLVRLRLAKEELTDYVAAMPNSGWNRKRVSALLHVLDHMERLLRRCEDDERLAIVPHDRRLARLARVFAGVIATSASLDEGGRSVRFTRLEAMIRAMEERYRIDVIGHAAPVPATMREIATRLDAMRWLHRSANHLSRIHQHLVDAADRPTPPAGSVAGV